VARVRELTGGLGADVVIVAAPSAPAQEQAVRMVRKRGVVVLFGGLPKADPMTSLDGNIIHYGELRVIGAFSYHPSHHAKALDYIARGQISARRYITRFSLADVVAAFEAAKSGTAIKVIITPA
jgi:L-iditol 2-dehydrogenase